MYVCMYAYVYVCTYVRMYVCMYMYLVQAGIELICRILIPTRTQPVNAICSVSFLLDIRGNVPNSASNLVTRNFLTTLVTFSRLKQDL